jgi:hypothetical protein
MDTITFRCEACQHVLRVSADKAGRKAKCTKCGTPLTIPASNTEAAQEPALAPVAAKKEVDETKDPAMAAEASPAPPKVDSDDDEAGSITYGIKDDPKVTEADKKERDKKTALVTGPGRRLVKKLSKITHAREWLRTSLGLQVIAAGLCVWLAAYLIYRVPLVLGLAAGEEYGAQADERLLASSAETGRPPDLNYIMYAVALVSGNNMADFMIWVVRFSQVLYLLMYLLLLAGYVICLSAPNQRGTRLQIGVLITLALANALFGIAFKLLPMLGVYEYTILPIAVPEIEMVSMNASRIESIYTFWLRWPILEMYWALLVTILFYLEPAIIAVFVRAVALGLKADILEEKAMSAMKLAFSQIFIQSAWMLLALCGTSEVLLTVLRIIYMIGMGFFVGQMIYTILLLFSVRSVVYQQLGDEAERLLEEEADKSTSRTSGEEQEEEEEDEDEDEEEDED